MNKANSPAIVIEGEAAAALLEPLTDLVIRAGAAILAVNRTAMRVEGKLDGSPVTEADLAADRIIAEGLARIAPQVPAVSEERVNLAEPSYNGSFFLIDPLDGTKEFVAGRDEFTVNLALVTNGTPLLGIVGAPALGLVWRGLVGHGAERLQSGEKPVAEPIHTRPYPKRGEPWIAAVSRSHGDSRTEAFIAARPGAIRKVLGSAVKFGRVAEGQADIYPRLAPTSEWDIAAGHAVVTAAGGMITDAQGAPLLFGSGRAGFIVPEFIAWGDPSAVA
ncbi:MAG: 3'(2'),5'-bisphosphate nucleotidase CysQ [Bradyrhizobium sp.]